MDFFSRAMPLFDIESEFEISDQVRILSIIKLKQLFDCRNLKKNGMRIKFQAG